MKRIEWSWNLVHYYLYKFDIKFRKSINYVNPIYWFNTIPFVKKYHAKHGVNDMNELAIHVFNNPKSGISVYFAGSVMGILLALMEYSFFNIIQAISGVSMIEWVWSSNIHLIIYLILLLIPVIYINQKLLFKKDKYLNYFKNFDSLSPEKDRLYGWIVFALVVLIISSFFGSFFAIN